MPSEAKETRPAASDDEHETSRASEAKAAAYDERDAAPENVGPSSSPAFGEEQRAPAAPLALERARLVAQQGLHAHAEALRSIDPTRDGGMGDNVSHTYLRTSSTSR